MDWVPPPSFDEYRLIRALGRGNMGQVWLAHDTVLDRLVAVKFITAPAADEAIRQRFLTEARAAAHVQHPNVIAVYRFGEIGLRPYLISEYVRGESLDKVARPVTWPRLLEIAIGLARGLAAAHGRGILHRDLKPANAMVSETGEVKLLDFGLAKLLPHVGPPHRGTPPDRERMMAVPGSPGERMVALRAKGARFVVPSDESASTVDVVTGAGQNVPSGGIAPSLIVLSGGPLTMELWGPSAAIELSPSVTGTGAMIGTPAYMPPEAWRGEPATPRSDVYSLGALLYELGAGTPPHRGGSSEAVQESAVTTNAPSLAIAAPGMAPGFAAIVDRCLRRDPTERFASGDAVREALETLAAGDNARASERGEPLRRRPSPHSRWVVGIGAAFAVGLFAYIRIGGGRLAPPVHRVVAKHARPDAPAQHSLAAARSPSLGPAGGCPVGMVPVPAGTFRMGSSKGEGDENEHPQHQVTLSSYCIDEMEVTVADYTACVADKGCSAAPLTPKSIPYPAKDTKHYSRSCNRDDRPKHPINCIDWNQAAAYCTWQGKRLPTEAEWEYAARGNDGRVYPWGDEAPNATRLNMCGGDCGNLAMRETSSGIPVPSSNGGWDTTPVGSYPEGRSPFGALDMVGNVAEWTADWYDLYTAQAETNPQGPDSGTSRVARGGRLWRNSYDFRIAGRNWPDPEDRDIDLGFRCAHWP